MSKNFKSEEDWFVYYVASPYSHSDTSVRQDRYNLAVKAAKTLTRLGYAAFVPIAYDGLWDLDPNYKVDHSWSFWEKIDLPILDRCSALILFEIPGWEKSAGVAGELEHCNKVGIPVMSLSLSDLDSDEIIHQKMTLLKGMIKRNKRALATKFNSEIETDPNSDFEFDSF